MSKRVLYNGIEMAEGWPQQIEEAQKYSSAHVHGLECERIRFGAEAEEWGASAGPCGDCCVVKGQLHVPGCDIERCPICGSQILGCLHNAKL